VSGGRVVAEQTPADKPDTSDHSEHVEDRRPTASETVVAQNSRQNHPDSDIYTTAYYAGDR